MHRCPCAQLLPLVLVFTPSLASAQIPERDDLSRARFAPADPPALNRFTLSYRAGFNVTASFANRGTRAGAGPGLPIAGIDHNYDNGYNRVDISGNAGGKTWNWGYTTPDQVVGDTIVFNNSRSGVFARDVDGDPNHGLELTYNRRLGYWGPWSWGLEAAWNYTSVDLHDRSVRSDGPLTIDTYALGGVIPPLPPYAGTTAGPGPLIGDAPTRLPVTVASSFAADVHGLHLGPYLEIPVTDHLALSFSGGLALLAVDSHVNFRESAAIPGAGTTAKVASGSHRDALAGGYLAGELALSVSDSVKLVTGVQYQSTGHYTHREANKQARLNFGDAVFLMFGAAYSF